MLELSYNHLKMLLWMWVNKKKYELFDCDGDEIEDVMEHEDDSSDESGVKDSEDTNLSTPAPATSCSRSTAVPLANIASDALLKSDCSFLDDIKSVLDKHKTSTLFTPNYFKFKAAYRCLMIRMTEPLMNKNVL